MIWVHLAFALVAVVAAGWFVFRPIKGRHDERLCFLREHARTAGWRHVATKHGLARVRANLKGFKTVLAARAVQVVAFLIFLNDSIMPTLIGYDWTPLVPEKYRAIYPVMMMFVGIIFEILRHYTSTPVAEKD